MVNRWFEDKILIFGFKFSARQFKIEKYTNPK